MKTEDGYFEGYIGLRPLYPEGSTYRMSGEDVWATTFTILGPNGEVLEELKDLTPEALSDMIHDMEVYGISRAEP